MTRFQQNRLRAALYLCIADLFIGASGVIIVLVVLSTRTDVARYPRNVDVIVGCASGSNGSRVIADRTGPDQSQSVEDWVRSVEPHGLIARVGVLTPPDALGCYADVEMAVLAHNRRLTTRSGEGGVIAVVFLPETSDE